MKRFFIGSAIVALALGVGSPVSCIRAAAQAPAATITLPYGVADVLRLVRAKVAEDTIISFIQNSGTVYNLQANEIVYLRNEGVTDRVINAMLEQKRKFIEQSGTSATAPASNPTVPPAAPPVAEQPAATQPAPVYVQPPNQTAPSSVYVIPYGSVPSVYYGYYDRPYPYYYVPYPYYYGG